MKTLDKLFQNALDLPASERDAFLAQACAGDQELKASVLRLLASDQAADDHTFWKGSALSAEAKLDPQTGPPPRRPDSWRLPHC